MDSPLITIIIAILGSGALSSFIGAWFNRQKNRAQVQNMTIEGDIKVGDSWKDYAGQLRKDFTSMKNELNLIHNKYLDLEKKYNDLYADHASVVEESHRDKAKIKELEDKVAASEERIKQLQKELDTYKSQ